MADILSNSFESILKASHKGDSELREAINEHAEKLKKQNFGEDDPAEGEIESPGSEKKTSNGRIDPFLAPLLLAMEHGKPQIVSLALDCVQKLISHGHLRGRHSSESAGLDSEKKLTVVDTVIRKVCSIEDNGNSKSVKDSKVQLKVINVLLTAITLPSCEIHGTTLLTAVRACYHICLYSHNAVNRSTAKATLTQIVSVVFQRMDQTDSKLRRKGRKKSNRVEKSITLLTPNHLTRNGIDESTSNADTGAESRERHEDANKRMVVNSNENGLQLATDTPVNESEVEQEGSSADIHMDDSVDANVSSNALCKDVLHKQHPEAAEPNNARHHTEDDNRQEALSAESSKGLDDSLTVGNSESATTDESEKRYERKLQDSVSVDDSTAETQQIKKSDTDEISTSATVNSEVESSGAHERMQSPLPSFASIQHFDAYLLFSALCKLSIKNQNLIDGVDGNSRVPDPVALRSKLLSLDLLLSCLETGKSALRVSSPTFDSFLFNIRSNLIPSLVKNSASTNAKVVGLSLKIFVLLEQRYSELFKNELSVVISEILLPIVESSNSPQEHKVLVLEAILKICNDYNALVHMFLNYDCEWNSLDLFARIVDLLSRIASDCGVLSKGEFSLHSIALDSLVSVLNLLADFSNVDNPVNDLQDELTTHNEAILDRDKSLEDQNQVKNDCDIELSIPSDSLRVSDALIPDSVEENTEGNNSVRLRTQPDSKHANAETSEDQNSNSSRSSHVRKLKVDSFQQKRKYRQMIESAASKFLLKPARGVEYLIESGYLQKNPTAIAAALLELQDSFDKTAIGEFLSDTETNGEILDSYVDQFDFKGAVIDGALRLFLSGFRLPGEAQKVDRLMEKFASRYVLSNPGVFPSADTAYILAFSIMILQTDLHNESNMSVKKMSKEDFIANNCGIAGGRDLDPKFLAGIYDRVKEKPFSLKEDDKMRSKISHDNSDGEGFFGNSKEVNFKRQWVAFSRERQELVEHATTLLCSSSAGLNRLNSADTSDHLDLPERNGSSVGFNGGRFAPQKKVMDNYLASIGGSHHAEDHIRSPSYMANFDYRSSNEHVEPMFAVIWGPFTAVFSKNLQSLNDPRMVASALLGMKKAIRIACRFNLMNEKQTLFNALIKFTLLANSFAKEMSEKHIACIKTLIEIAREEADFLGTSWVSILSCFSQISRLQMFSAGVDVAMSAVRSTDSVGNETLSESRRRTVSHSSVIEEGTSKNSGFLSYFQPPPDVEELTRTVCEENAQRISRSIDMIDIDRVYLDSVYFGAESIIGMVRALVAVSCIELNLEVTDPEVVGDNTINTDFCLKFLDRRPRTFSLQKIVEVAYSNMLVRPRFVWASIWAVLSHHFTVAGCHADIRISMYAVDSLRQLSVKFLEKEELSGFNFQSQFMEPFKVMMTSSSNTQLRDLVLCCIQNIVLTRSRHLRSGWRVVLHVLCEGGHDASVDISTLSFQVLLHIWRDHFNEVEIYFSEVIDCICACAGNQSASADVSGNAVRLLEAACAHVLGFSHEFNALDSGKKLEAESNRASLEVNFFDIPKNSAENERPSRLFHLLSAFCNLIRDSRLKVRTLAGALLFNMLQSCFWSLSPRLWTVVFSRCLFPLFHSLKENIPSFTKDIHARLKRERTSFSPAVEASPQFREYVTNEASLSKCIPIEVLLETECTSFHSTTLNVILGWMIDLVCFLFNYLATKDSEQKVSSYELEIDGMFLSVETQDLDSLGPWKREFSKFFSAEVLEPTIALLEWAILSENVFASSSGFHMLRKLLTESASNFSHLEWKNISSSMSSMIHDTVPSFIFDKDVRNSIFGNDTSRDGSKTAGNTSSLPKTLDLSSMKPDDQSNVSDLDARSVEASSLASPTAVAVEKTFPMCAIHLQLLKVFCDQISRNLVKIDEPIVIACLETIQESSAFARQFNDDLLLRAEMLKLGIFPHNHSSEMKDKGDEGPNFPALYKQEVTAIGGYTRILFSLYDSIDKGKIQWTEGGIEQVRARLESSLQKLVTHYIFQDRMVAAEHESSMIVFSQKVDRDSPAVKGESEAEIERRFFSPLILDVLACVLEWNTSSIKENISWLFPLLTTLIDCRSHEIHCLLRQIFEEKLSDVIGIQFND